MTEVTNVEIATWVAKSLGYVVVEKKDFSDSKRTELAAKGLARPDGSYPIEDEADLHNAVNDYNRTGQDPAVKSHIIGAAKKLGIAAALPDSFTKAFGATAPPPPSAPPREVDANRWKQPGPTTPTPPSGGGPVDEPYDPDNKPAPPSNNLPSSHPLSTKTSA